MTYSSGKDKAPSYLTTKPKKKFPRCKQAQWERLIYEEGQRVESQHFKEIMILTKQTDSFSNDEFPTNKKYIYITQEAWYTLQHYFRAFSKIVEFYGVGSTGKLIKKYDIIKALETLRKKYLCKLEVSNQDGELFIENAIVRPIELPDEPTIDSKTLVEEFKKQNKIKRYDEHGNLIVDNNTL